MIEHVEIDQIAESRWQIRHIADDGTETIHSRGYVIGYRPYMSIVNGEIVELEAPVYGYTPAERAKGVVRVDELTDAQGVIWVAAAMFPTLGITGGNRWEPVLQSPEQDATVADTTSCGQLPAGTPRRISRNGLIGGNRREELTTSREAARRIRRSTGDADAPPCG